MKTEQDLIGCLDKLNNLCRVCLCESNVKSEELNQYWKSLYEKVMSCMQIEFLMKDTLPLEICDMCCKELEVADKLRIKCENSNAVLQRVYQQYIEKDKQKQSKQTTLLEDHLEMSHSDDELQDKCWAVPSDSLEDNKEQIKDVILHINLEGRVVNEDKQKQIKDIRTVHKESTSCGTDDTATKTANDLTIENKIDLMSVKTNLFICDVCNKVLKCKQTIISHVAKQHGTLKTNESYFKVVGFGVERLWKCLKCPYTTKRKSHMTVHSRIHMDEKPYVCDICSRCFTHHSTLASHKRSHFDTMYYTCQECGKQLKCRTTWNRHQRVHSKERNFVCKLCNKAFKSQETLSNHMKRHYQIKNFSCEICGATFVTKSDLNNHKHVHTNIKRFFCTQCDYSCRWKNTLDMHTRRHRKDKTLECDECEYACYTNTELKSHKTKHTKVQMFPCPICDEKLKHKRSISKHIKRKHGQKIEVQMETDQSIVK